MLDACSQLQHVTSGWLSSDTDSNTLSLRGVVIRCLCQGALGFLSAVEFSFAARAHTHTHTDTQSLNCGDIWLLFRDLMDGRSVLLTHSCYGSAHSVLPIRNICLCVCVCM